MRVVQHCNLQQYNSYRIPAQCEQAYFPDCKEDVEALMTGPLLAKPYVLLGSGHNVILAKTHYQTPFVIFHGNMNRITISGNHLNAQAGIFTSDLCKLALAKNLSGLEVFYDIPSTIGGAIAMNAGAYDEDIGAIVESVTYWDAPAAKVIQRPKTELGFAYRHSIFQNDPSKIVLEATLTLQPAASDAIQDKMYSIRDKRWATQPREYPNAGSVFKRPAGKFVGPMLDELNLKGYSFNGFRVSPKHSGFIENTGIGTGQDLLCLIHDIQQKVQHAFGIQLELEQRVIDIP